MPSLISEISRIIIDPVKNVFEIAAEVKETAKSKISKLTAQRLSSLFAEIKNIIELGKIPYRMISKDNFFKLSEIDYKDANPLIDRILYIK